MAEGWKDLLFSDPFKVEDDKFDEGAQSQEALIDKGGGIEQPVATKGELWGYYLCYNGDNVFTTASFGLQSHFNMARSLHEMPWISVSD
ncbi:hypothetical protein Unana1_08792 [Umbelopsis nana]